MVMTWADLRALRERGQRPLLRTFVTTDRDWAHRLTELGVAAIVHEAGEPMPVKLLDGLDVVLDLGECTRVGRVKRLMDERDTHPARLQAWCRCQCCLTPIVQPCRELSSWPDA